MLDRRLLRLAVPLAVGALALTACGGSSGGSKSGSGGGKKTYTLAYQGPLSGDNAQLGINMDNGVKLAVEQAASAGLPYTLKFADSDDVGDPAQAPTAAQKLIDDKSVIAVVGPAFSGATKASEPLFSEANLVSVSPSATNPTLTSQGFKTFYRVVPPDDAQGAEAASYMVKGLKAKSIYLVDDKSEYGVGLADVIAKSLTGTKLKREGIPVTKDYSTIAQKVASSGADTVYYAGYFAEFALFTKAAKAAGYKGALLSGDGSNDDQFIVQAGKAAAEGVYFTCPCGDANVDPNAASFLTAYKAKFNTNPGTYSPEAYDAANAIIAALKQVGDNPTRQKVADAVKAIDYKGITKQIKFQPNGEVSGKTIFVYQVKGGKRAILGTTAELAK